jgi:uncharacterized protein (DUF849 family)
MTRRPVILTAAVTGNLTKPSQNAALPVTPHQIADAALAAADAGAAIVHLHVRDPETAKGSMRLDLYEVSATETRRSAKAGSPPTTTPAWPLPAPPSAPPNTA